MGFIRASSLEHLDRWFTGFAPVRGIGREQASIVECR